ncbi:MAG: mechanosensitive ion channel family protein [Leptolyngbyaceae cyanobacterium]
MSNLRLLSSAGRIKPLILAIVTGVSCLLLNAFPAGAQFNNPLFDQVFDSEAEILAPVLELSTVRLDGRSLFRVAAVAGFSSEVRAKEISQRLQTYAAQQVSPTVEWRLDSGSNQPVIYTGERFLMTITSADASLAGAVSTEVRAEELQDTLITALEYYQYERQPEVIQQRLRQAGILSVLILVLGLGLHRVHHWLSNVPKSGIADEEDVTRQILWRQAKRVYQLKNWFFWLGELLIWVGGIFLILGLFPYTRAWQHTLIQLFRVPLRIAIALAVSYGIIHLGDIVIDRLFLTIYGQTLPISLRTQRSSLRFSTFSQVAKSILIALVIAVCILVILAIIGIDLGPLLTSAGIIGLALSLASQSVLKDIINGFMILMEDHYGIGDIIIVGEMSGFVETMNLRITQLRNEEGRLITIPNGQINVVQNLSKEWSRVDLKISVALDDDIDHALSIIKQVADDMSHDPNWTALILEEPLLLGVDGIDYSGATVRLWIKTLPLKQWDVAREYRRRLKIAFEDADIDFGIPKQVVRMVTAESENAVLPLEPKKTSAADS